jgi:hypothetical protein
MILTEQIYEIVRKAKDDTITIEQAVGDIIIAVGADKAEKDMTKNLASIDQDIEKLQTTVTGENGAPIRG